MHRIGLLKEQEEGLTETEIIEKRKTRVKTYEQEKTLKMKKCQERARLNFDPAHAKKIHQ